MGKKLYAGNLSYNVTSADLERMFSEFGAVRSAEVIQDRDTGRSKGFGFVEMDDDNAANQAIEGLNLKEHDGRAMSVDEAAEALGVHQQTIRGYIRTGKLAAFRIAGERAIRVYASDLYGLLEPLESSSNDVGD